MYDIDSLIKTFARHGEKSEEDKARLLQEFRRDYPDEEVHETLTDPFNICFALHSMAMEIKRLRQVIAVTKEAWTVDLREKQ